MYNVLEYIEELLLWCHHVKMSEKSSQGAQRTILKKNFP